MVWKAITIDPESARPTPMSWNRCDKQLKLCFRLLNNNYSFCSHFSIPNTLFQTPSNALTSMGSRYVELERLKHRPSVFIGPDGKIVNPGDPPPRLAFGSSSSHQDPTCLPCPLCKRTFVTSKGILRHAMRCEHNEANDNFYVRL